MHKDSKNRLLIFFIALCFFFSLSLYIPFLKFLWIIFLGPFFLIFSGFQYGGVRTVFNIYGTSYNHILCFFFLGCLSWSIVVYYFVKINSSEIRKVIRSIILFYPFWFGISIFLGTVDVVALYNTFWLLVQILMYIWVGVGVLFAFNMILVIFSPQIGKIRSIGKILSINLSNQSDLEKDKLEKPQYSIFLKVVNFLVKHEFKFLTLIILSLGFFFIISNFVALGRYTAQTTIFTFFTTFIIILLFDINYITFKSR